MKIISSYGVEIVNNNKLFLPTINIYRQAVSFLIEVVKSEWDKISDVPSDNEKMTIIEKLVHSAKTRKAKYDFDNKFYKFPSYLRRTAIHNAIGCVSSYLSNYDNWVKNNKMGKEPKLTLDRNCFPVFYKGNMYKQLENGIVLLKLFINNDWVFVPVKLRQTDLKYIKKNMSESKQLSPTLERRHKKFYLRFSFEENVKLETPKVYNQKICAVDLGINTDATCSIINADGTIEARKFINRAAEKDHLYRLLGRIKKRQKKSGSRSAHNMWAYASRLNNEIAKKIAFDIVSYASANDCDVIVFEHLDMKGKKHGCKKQKLAMWKKNTIQEIVERNAHRMGMRVSRVCAWKTSQLAYDGSGKVRRGKDGGFKTRELCRFVNGKVYNCDLSASYNIGARYYIREYLKTLSEKMRSQVQAKVPELERRAVCTYNTFLQMLNALKCIA